MSRFVGNRKLEIHLDGYCTYKSKRTSNHSAAIFSWYIIRVCFAPNAELSTAPVSLVVRIAT
jgi:hypothetical protein